MNQERYSDFCLDTLNPFIQELINLKNILLNGTAQHDDIEHMELLKKVICAHDKLKKDANLTVQTIVERFPTAPITIPLRHSPVSPARLSIDSPLMRENKEHKEREIKEKYERDEKERNDRRRELEQEMKKEREKLIRERKEKELLEQKKTEDEFDRFFNSPTKELNEENNSKDEGSSDMEKRNEDELVNQQMNKAMTMLNRIKKDKELPTHVKSVPDDVDEDSSDDEKSHEPIDMDIADDGQEGVPPQKNSVINTTNEIEKIIVDYVMNSDSINRQQVSHSIGPAGLSLLDSYINPPTYNSSISQSQPLTAEMFNNI